MRHQLWTEGAFVWRAQENYSSKHTNIFSFEEKIKIIKSEMHINPQPVQNPVQDTSWGYKEVSVSETDFTSFDFNEEHRAVINWFSDYVIRYNIELLVQTKTN